MFRRKVASIVPAAATLSGTMQRQCYASTHPTLVNGNHNKNDTTTSQDVPNFIKNGSEEAHIESELVDVIDIMTSHGKASAAATVEDGARTEFIPTQATERQAPSIPSYMRGTTAATSQRRKAEGVLTLDTTDKHKFLSAYLGGDILSPPTSHHSNVSTVCSASSVVSSAGENSFTVAGAKLRSLGSFKSFTVSVTVRASCVMARDPVHLSGPHVPAESFHNSLTWPAMTLTAAPSSTSSAASTVTESDEAAAVAWMQRDRRLSNQSTHMGYPHKEAAVPTRKLRADASSSDSKAPIVTNGQRARLIEKLHSFARYEVSLGTSPMPPQAAADEEKIAKPSVAKKKLASKLGLSVASSSSLDSDIRRNDRLDALRSEVLSHFTPQHQRLRKLIFTEVMPVLLLDLSIRLPGVLINSRVDFGSKEHSVTLLERCRQDFEYVFGAVWSSVDAHCRQDGTDGEALTARKQYLKGLWQAALAACRAQVDALLLNAAVSQAATGLSMLAATACGGVPQNSLSTWWQDGGAADALNRAEYAVEVAQSYAKAILGGFTDVVIAKSLPQTSSVDVVPPLTTNDTLTASLAHTVTDAQKLLTLALATRMEASRALLRLEAMKACFPQFRHTGNDSTASTSSVSLTNMLLVAEALASGALGKVVADTVIATASVAGDSTCPPLLNSVLPTATDVLQFCCNSTSTSDVLKAMALRENAAAVLTTLCSSTTATSEDKSDLSKVQHYVANELRSKVLLNTRGGLSQPHSTTTAAIPTIVSLLSSRIYKSAVVGSVPSLTSALVAFHHRPSSSVAATEDPSPNVIPVGSFRAGWPLSFLIYLFEKSHGDLNAIRELHEILLATVGGAFKGVGSFGVTDGESSVRQNQRSLNPALTPEALACATFSFLSALSTCGPLGSFGSTAQSSQKENISKDAVDGNTNTTIVTHSRAKQSRLKPSEVVQWAKEAYDDYVSWVPQSHWRNTLVLYGLLQCVSSAQDNWKAQVMYQQIVMQARISKGEAEAAGSEMGARQSSSTVGIAGIGMARTKGRRGGARRFRIDGDGYGENTATGGQQLGTEMDRGAFDAKARNERSSKARAMPSFGIRNVNRSKGRKSIHNELGMRVSGVVTPALLNKYLLSFRDPFQAFHALEAQFLFNMRPSADTIHILMARLLLDHLEVREDNTIVTTPNPHFVRQQLHRLETGEDSTPDERMNQDAARRVPLFSTLTDQRKALVELERAEEAEALQLLIDSVDRSISRGDGGNSTLSVDDQTVRRHNMLRQGLTHRREYLYERQGQASDLLFTTFYLLQKGNKGALQAGITHSAERSRASQEANSTSEDKALKPSLRYFVDGPTPDGLTVSLALLQVFKNYARDAEAICNENIVGTAQPETEGGSQEEHRSRNAINAALLGSPKLAVVGAVGTPHTLAVQLFSDIQRSGSAKLQPEAAVSLEILISLAEEAVDASLRLLCDGYYPIWALLTGASSPHDLPKRLLKRVVVAIEEAKVREANIAEMIANRQKFESDRLARDGNSKQNELVAAPNVVAYIRSSPHQQTGLIPHNNVSSPTAIPSLSSMGVAVLKDLLAHYVGLLTLRQRHQDQQRTQTDDTPVVMIADMTDPPALSLSATSLSKVLEAMESTPEALIAKWSSDFSKHKSSPPKQSSARALSSDSNSSAIMAGSREITCGRLASQRIAEVFLQAYMVDCIGTSPISATLTSMVANSLAIVPTVFAINSGSDRHQTTTSPLHQLQQTSSHPTENVFLFGNQHLSLGIADIKRNIVTVDNI